MGNIIITDIDEKKVCENRLVIVHDFRGTLLADVNHYILKKKAEKW